MISPPDLFSALSSPKPIVVFDIRDKDSFSKEHIWSSTHLDLTAFPSFPAIAKDVRANLGGTTAVTPASHRNLFMNREIYEVVVVDEDGTDAKSVCKQLQHKVFHGKHTHLLVGGYKLFSMLYPSLCIGSPGQDDYLINKHEREWMEKSPTEVLPYLFVGNAASAQNFWAIDLLDIGFMVNVHASTANYAPSAYVYMRCDQDSLPFGDLEPLFTEVFEFIEKAKGKGGKVLVYSADEDDGLAGMVVCAYLIRANEWPLERAFIAFKQKLPLFSPNVSILARLGEYEASLFGTAYLNASSSEGAGTTKDDQGRHGGGSKDRGMLSDELRYVRRQQMQQQEEEDAFSGEDEGEEQVDDDLC